MPRRSDWLTCLYSVAYFVGDRWFWSNAISRMVSPAAVIVPRPGARADEAQLLAHCREELAGYKVPRRFVFTTPEKLPLTTTGKVQKQRLPELFSDAGETSAA